MKTCNVLFSLLIVSALFMSACENEVDETPNALPSGDASVMDAAPPPSDGGATCADCITVGSWYRFNKLQVESLDGIEHPVVAILNPAWQRDVEGMELNVLFEVTAYEGDQLILRAINAASTGDGQVCLLENTAIELVTTLGTEENACAFGNPDPSGINVYAGTEENTKNCAPNRPVPNTIPVEQMRLRAAFNSDCSRILQGDVFEASIPADTLDEICTCTAGLASGAEACGVLDPDHVNENGSCAGCNPFYSSLGQLVAMFGELNKGCISAAGEPAVCLQASFEAERLDASPPLCP